MAASRFQGGSVTGKTKESNKELTKEIISFCRHIAGSFRITAMCICGNCASEFYDARIVIEVLLIIPGFPPKIMNYVKVLGDHTIIVLTVDQGVFENDVDKGFLGEALADGIVLPYVPLLNSDYLCSMEVALKRRLTQELLENLVLRFPELSRQLRIKPEYFLYETVMTRVRLFPPMIHTLDNLLRVKTREKNMQTALNGFSEALRQLEREGKICISNGYVRICEELAQKAVSRRARFVSLFRPTQRALFVSLLGILPGILNLLSQNREFLQRFPKAPDRNSASIHRLEDPENYVFFPTANGLIPLANKMDIIAFVRKMLGASKDAKMTVKRLGGMLNDVYLIRVLVDSEERNVVAKDFRDWSNFKWFPLTLWSIGTRTFTVLGRSRLEKEIAINQLLHSKGLAVPKILCASPNQRLVFMEYIDGEDLSKVAKGISTLKDSNKLKEDLAIIEKVGRLIAKVHALGVSLGDSKPENILIAKNGEIYLMDFEQASRNGDKVWDIAEFLYYSGHFFAPLAEPLRAELLTESFINGYSAEGGNVENVKKAGDSKYTKVFSIFTLPRIILTISNYCRRTELNG